MKKHQIETHNISSFVMKLLKMLEDTRHKNIISWTEDGESIRIDSHSQSLELTLSKYFNHTKISSFVRQLNLYGFKKVSEKGSEMLYKHENFVRDQPNQQKLIKRKRKLRNIAKKVQLLEEKQQNPQLDDSKFKLKGLLEIYSRIRTQNQRLISQTKQINNQALALTRVKNSAFLTRLKDEYNVTPARSEQNSIEQSQPKSSNQQQSTAEPENIPQNRYQNSVSSDYFMNGTNGQNDGESNNEMDMFEEDIEELSCEKMGMGNEEEAYFWKQERREERDSK